MAADEAGFFPYADTPIDKRLEDDLDYFSCMDEYEELLYPCVSKALGLNWDQKYLRQHSLRKLCEKMDAEEYIKEYIWWNRNYFSD